MKKSFASNNQQSPFGLFGFPKTPGRDGFTIISASDVIGWNPNDMGFSIQCMITNLLTQGRLSSIWVEIFISAICIYSLNELIFFFKPTDFVWINFWKNFWGTALELRTTELSGTEKKITKLGEKVDEWFILLTKKKPCTVTIDVILQFFL